MNILQLRPRLEIGGADQSLLILSQGLQQAGYRVAIASQGGQQLEAARKLNITVYQLPLYPPSGQNLARSVRLVKQIVRQDKIDVLHSHHRFTSLVCKLTGAPTVSTVHEIKTNRVWLTRLGLGQQIITFSNAVKQHLVSYVGVSSEKISVLPMGVKLNPPTHAQIVEAGQLIRVQPAFACVARLSEEKGVDILLQAIAHLKTEGYQFCCYIVGDGPQSGYLQNLSTQMALDDVVQFIGWQENIAGIIANVAFLVQPSRSEGLGLAVLEGMAQAKPTIASRVGGLPEIIGDGKTGLLVPPDDAAALAQAIAKMLHEPAWTQSLGQAGQQFVTQNFSIEHMVTQTEAVYRRVLRRRV